jgi:hypothetical protein
MTIEQRRELLCNDTLPLSPVAVRLCTPAASFTISTRNESLSPIVKLASLFQDQQFSTIAYDLAICVVEQGRDVLVCNKTRVAPLDIHVFGAVELRKPLTRLQYKIMLSNSTSIVLLEASAAIWAAYKSYIFGFACA